MKKDTKSRHESKSVETRYFQPDEELTDFMQKRLELEQERDKLLSKKSAGAKLPNKFYKAIKSSGSRKSEILNDIIFPSMTNLIYFFEQICHHAELDSVFETDLIELLDPSWVNQDMDTLNKETTARIFSTNNFARLVLTVLKIPERNMTYDKPLINFRIALLYQLQSIIRELVRDILAHDYGSSGAIAQKVDEDFYETLRWLTFIAKASADAVEVTNRRQIGPWP